MTRKKAEKPKVAKAPANGVQTLSDFDAKKKRVVKIRMWAFIIWVVGFMLIMAKWGKFNLWG
jgi:hypothetical protein